MLAPRGYLHGWRQFLPKSCWVVDEIGNRVCRRYPSRRAGDSTTKFGETMRLSTRGRVSHAPFGLRSVEHDADAALYGGRSEGVAPGNIEARVRLDAMTGKAGGRDYSWIVSTYEQCRLHRPQTTGNAASGTLDKSDREHCSGGTSRMSRLC